MSGIILTAEAKAAMIADLEIEREPFLLVLTEPSLMLSV
jgi:hypothetical protein